MKEIRPLIPVNPQGLDEIANELLNENITQDSNTTSSSNVRNPETYLILPGNLRAVHYPDLLVSTSRLGYDDEVKRISKKLNLNLQNNDQGFIGDINHEQALSLNSNLNDFTLAPRYFTDFLWLLLQGSQGKLKVHYANGREIDQSKLETYLKEIVEVRNPYRAEWLDAKYGDNIITYTEVINNGFKKVTEQLDNDTLMENKIPGINLESWLKNPTIQGLPRKSTKEGKLYYLMPQDGYVAWFGADSAWAVLSCGRDSTYSDTGLGVRRAKIKK